LPPGTFSIVAIYEGNGSFAGSTSGRVSLKVTQSAQAAVRRAGEANRAVVRISIFFVVFLLMNESGFLFGSRRPSALPFMSLRKISITEQARQDIGGAPETARKGRSQPGARSEPCALGRQWPQVSQILTFRPVN
jgi:hypothetical protein